MADLVPVDKWTWNRYYVKFLNKKETVIKSSTLVCTPTSVHCTVSERSGLIGGCHTFEYEILEDNVSSPPKIGEIYGLDISHDGWDLPA